MTTLEYITDLKAENEKLREIAGNLANYYDHALPDGDWTRTPMWGMYQAAKAALTREAK